MPRKEIMPAKKDNVIKLTDKQVEVIMAASQGVKQAEERAELIVNSVMVGMGLEVGAGNTFAVDAEKKTLTVSLKDAGKKEDPK